MMDTQNQNLSAAMPDAEHAGLSMLAPDVQTHSALRDLGYTSALDIADKFYGTHFGDTYGLVTGKYSEK